MFIIDCTLTFNWVDAIWILSYFAIHDLYFKVTQMSIENVKPDVRFGIAMSIILLRFMVSILGFLFHMLATLYSPCPIGEHTVSKFVATDIALWIVEFPTFYALFQNKKDFPPPQVQCLQTIGYHSCSEDNPRK